jgi:hypothetical protein
MRRYHNRLLLHVERRGAEHYDHAMSGGQLLPDGVGVASAVRAWILLSELGHELSVCMQRRYVAGGNVQTLSSGFECAND